MVSTASAELYSVRINFNTSAYVGSCGFDEDQTLNTMGECVGNFLNPSIPNPLGFLAPISGSRLQEKLEATNFFSWDMISTLDFRGIFERLINIPIVLVAIIIEMATEGLTFLLVFFFKFLFAYLFYVSIGFQTLMFYLDRNKQLENMEKVHITFALIAISSIVTLTNGLGWINWL